MKSSITEQKFIEYLLCAICWVYGSDQNCQNCCPNEDYILMWEDRQKQTNKISKHNIVYVELISTNGKSRAY